MKPRSGHSKSASSNSPRRSHNQSRLGKCVSKSFWVEHSSMTVMKIHFVESVFLWKKPHNHRGLSMQRARIWHSAKKASRLGLSQSLARDKISTGFSTCSRT